MEKKEFKISKLGKVGTLIPALLAAGMLNCAAESFHKSPNSKYTSVGNKTLVYEQESSVYSENNTQETLETILKSDLNQMATYNRLENLVQNEIAEYLSEMNTNTLSLARLYRSLEEYSFNNSGLTQERINEITSNNFQNSSNQENLKIVRTSVQHNMHLALDTQTLIRFHADEAEMLYLDEGDFHNEYLSFNTKGKRNIKQESMAVTDAMIKDLLACTQYDYSVNGFNGEKIAKQISNNLTKIQKVVTKKQLNSNDYNDLVNIINETADLLPEAMFGTIAMRRALVTEFASQYAINKLLTNITKLGYDIDNIKPEIFVEQIKKNNLDSSIRIRTFDTFKTDFAKQNRKTTINPALSFSSTNLHSDINIGLSGTAPISEKWDATAGVEFNLVKDYEQKELGYRVLGDLDFERNLKNGSALSLGIKGGVQIDEKGWSTPFGAQAGYKWKISDSLSVNFKAGALVDLQKSRADAIGSFGVCFRTGSAVISMGVNGGYTWDWSQKQITKPEQTPDTDQKQPDISTDTSDNTDQEQTEQNPDTPNNDQPEQKQDNPDAEQSEITTPGGVTVTTGDLEGLL